MDRLDALTRRERFERFVMPALDGCHYWLGNLQYRGYGYLPIQGKNYSAHRLSYLIYKGEIPEGLFVCHTCDNRMCVNPDHLWVGTHMDNVMDKMAKNRQPIMQGENHPSSKLNNEQVRFIKQNRRTIKAPELAKMFGVTKNRIFKIWSGYAWKGV